MLTRPDRLKCCRRGNLLCAAGVALRLLQQPQGYASQQRENQRCRRKASKPDPILQRVGVRAAANEVESKLAQCPEIGIKEQTGRLTNGNPEHAGRKSN